jgi:hypothetical protein
MAGGSEWSELAAASIHGAGRLNLLWLWLTVRRAPGAVAVAAHFVRGLLRLLPNLSAAAAIPDWLQGATPQSARRWRLTLISVRMGEGSCHASDSPVRSRLS